MNTPPVVSVILATNRGGPLLALTLGSLAAQTHTDWELIVIDDGSPDPDAIEEAVAVIPTATVIHQTNAGLSVARNLGIGRSRGRYLAFLDDDDLWMPERLAVQVAALEARPDAVACYCQWDTIDITGRVVGAGDLAPGDLRTFLRQERRAPIPTLLVARSALDRAGTFHPMLPPGEDIDLIYRLIRIGPFVFVPDVLVHYRQHEHQETGDVRGAYLASRRALHVQRWWSTRRGETELLGDITTGERRARRYWIDVLAGATSVELRKGHRAQAGRYILFGLRHDPVNTVRALTARALHRSV